MEVGVISPHDVVESCSLHYLLITGAEVNLSSYKSQTLLHQLFCPEKEVVSHVVEKTKLFLALGTCAAS